MEWWQGLLIFFGGLVVLMALRLPVAFSMGAMSILTMILFWGGTKGLSLLVHISFTSTMSFMLAAIPGFVLMAEILIFTGATDRAFASIGRVFGTVRGGVAYTTVAVSTLFAAVTGFSMAACVAIGSIAIPKMVDQGYRKDLAMGVVGGGAALAILIPPSVLMIIYGYLAEVSVGTLFFAGMLPGLLAATIFMGWIAYLSIRDPKGVPAGMERATTKERLLGLVDLSPMLFLIFMVLGTIYLGIATPTEAAAIGVAASLLLAIVYRKLTWPNLRAALWRAAIINGMIFAIIMAARLYAHVLLYTGSATELARFAAGLPISPLGIVIICMLLVLILGMFLGPMAIMFIIIPVFIPVLNVLEVDPIWFGILFVINSEIAFLSPPVGGNLFALRAIAPPGVEWGHIIKGCLPFIFLYLLTMAIVLAFPGIVWILPNMMRGG